VKPVPLGDDVKGKVIIKPQINLANNNKELHPLLGNVVSFYKILGEVCWEFHFGV
jgi:hypothetical protein